MEKDIVMIWPDGIWCYGSEHNEYDWKSDDFEVVSIPEDAIDAETWVEDYIAKGDKI
jgi:hypothetical protein